MGDPKHPRRQFERPRKPWEKNRIAEERKLVNTYGLKNKKEIWRFETILRNKRQNARKLLALPLEERLKREKELLDSMIKVGILRGKPSLDDALSLGINDLLERRLQTLVWRKNLANTPKQARQFITHGHIMVKGGKIDVPGYIVPLEEEATIKYYGKPMVLEEKKLAKEAKPEKGKTKKDQLREDFEEVKKAAEKMEKGGEKPKEKEGRPKEEKPAAKPVEAKEEKPVEKKERPKEAPKAEEKKEEKGEK